MPGTARMPERYRHTAVAHVMVAGAARAIDFYAEAFGATELFRVAHPDGRIVHAELGIAGSIVMLADAEGIFTAPTQVGGPTVGLHVYVEDADALCARALESGAELVQPVMDMFYGARAGMVRDPFGHLWLFLTHREELPVAEIARRGNELLRESAADGSGRKA